MAHLRNESDLAATLTSSDIDSQPPPAHLQSPHGEDKKSPHSVHQQSLVHDTSPLQYLTIAPPVNGPQPATSDPIQRILRSLFPKDLLPKGIFPEDWGTWRTGAIFCAFAAAIAFLINASVTIWAIAKFGNKELGTIHQGSCKEMEKMSRLFHFGINALATILLSSSNYCMQCLVAPTRSDIDRAHGRGLWVDIGVSSMRNFKIIEKSRVMLWCCLALSSCPLHLIYNSAIFSTITSNEYNVTLVPDYGLKSFQDNGFRNYTDESPWGFENLTNSQCIQAYGIQFVSLRRDVIVVVDAHTGFSFENNSLLQNGLSAATQGYGEPFYWICGFEGTGSAPAVDPNPQFTCNINHALENGPWTINGYHVKYCLSELTDEKCLLQFSRSILVVVTICNAVKCICMVLVAVNLKNAPLITIGDAISSFLATPDLTTPEMCIAAKKYFQKSDWANARDHGETLSRTWDPHKYRWYCVVSATRWLICISVVLSGIIATTLLLCLKLPTIATTYDTSLGLKSLWGIGFGTIDIRTFLGTVNSNDPFGGLISCVIIANIPQLVMSTLYLLYNSIFTSMILADEWDRLSYEFGTLRVTRPIGERQRSSYFLSLPYQYSMPLIVASGGMHWLISQSIFLARVLEYGYDGDNNAVDPEGSFTTVGFSPMATICTLVALFFMLLAVLANGFRRYSGRAPLVGSCSAAISAACHPGPEGPVNVHSALQWGVVRTDGDVGHCTFSDRYPVPPLIPGNSYAGTALRTERLGSGADQMPGS